MSIKVIKNENGTYSLNDNGTITNNLKVVFDKRKGCGDISLNGGNNSAGKKWLSESRFSEGITEVDLEALPTKNTSGTTTRTVTPKLNWEDFIDEADLETYKAIKARAEAKLQKKHVEDQIEATKKVLEELYGKLNIKVEV
jgi:hypothetical protein